MAPDPRVEPPRAGSQGDAGRVPTVISTRGLTKRYGAFTAVDHLDIEIAEGEIFGLLGPNGAGKTTTILMLLGLTEPSEGEARVHGLDPARAPLEVKRQVGYLPDNVGFYEGLTGRENLRYTTALNGIPRAEAERRIGELLARVGLADSADKRVETYSRGMRQRLGIADVLVKHPRSIILDEPTLGIDPEGTREVLALIRSLSSEERITVLLSSHLLYQVQEICTRVGIFARGRLVAAGRVEDLGDRLAEGGTCVVEVGTRPLDPALPLLESLPGVERVERGSGVWVVYGKGDLRATISARLAGRPGGPELLHLRRRGDGLDDIYLRYFQEVAGAAPPVA